MNKKFINGLLLATLMVGSAGSFTSCKDYDDDIDNLQNQIDGIIKDVTELQDKIKNGDVITNVTSNSDGLVFTMSNGQTYAITNGKDGKPGENGAPGTSWSIGTDGYWYKDGVKTEYKAVPDAGAAGSQGPAGPAGPTGPQGPAGKYYVPNEDGFFWIHEEGKDPVKTDISWVAAGPTAAFDGLTLILSNLKDADGKTLDPVTIECGKNVTSIAFIPNEYESGVPAVSFYTLGNKVLKIKNGAWTMKDGNALNISNKVNLSYRLNPQDALIAENASVSYVDRGVTGITVSRAAGDKTSLLSGSIVKGNDNGEMVVSTAINLSAYNGYFKNGVKKKDPIAALVLANGQSVVTSDYVYVEQSAFTAILVDSTLTAKSGNPMTANQTTLALIKEGQAAKTSTQSWTAYINNVAGGSMTSISAITEMAYDGSVDLKNVVALYVSNKKNFLSSFGYEGISYNFTLADSYMIGNTDQQYFVDLNGSVLSVKNDIGGKTQAIGRTPVVYVEALVNGNVVAAAYVKVAIKEAVGNKDGIDVVIPAPADNYNYPSVAAPLSVGTTNKTNQNVGTLTWQDINREIYGALGTDADKFRQDYNSPTVTVSVPVTWNKGQKSDVAVYTMTQSETTAPAYGKVGNWYNTNLPGLYVDAVLTGTATTTVNPINVWINNKIHTQDGTLANAVNAKGESLNSGNAVNIAGDAATYTVTIKYAPKNAAVNGVVVITRTFSVTETHEALIYSNYVSNNTVNTHGGLFTNGYLMAFKLTDAFKRGGEGATTADNIFSWFAAGKTINNIAGITITNVTIPQDADNNNLLKALNASGNDALAGLKDMTNEQKAAAYNSIRQLNLNGDAGLDALVAADAVVTSKVSFTLTLANGEVCSTPYTLTVNFKNPFVAGNVKGLKFNGNASLAEPLDAKTQVLVNDWNGEKILSWDVIKAATQTTPAQYGLKLSDVATSKDGYNIPTTNGYTLSYAFDDESLKYIAGMGQAELKVDPATGLVTYKKGADLAVGHVLNINVVADFKGGSGRFSRVICTIPVEITTSAVTE